MTLLRYVHPIVALAEHRHFGRAARALGISQPALSMAIRRAERELQARLFDRNRGEVTLTPFGESAVRRCRELLHSAREIVREVDLLRGLGAGRLVVTCGTYPAELSGHRAMGRLIAAHPGLACGIRLSEWHRSIQPVITHEADLALAEVGAAEADPRLVAEVIGTHPCRFFCRPGHPLLSLADPTIGHLATYPWALTSLPPRIFAMIDEPACAAGRLDETHERFIPAIHVETFQAAKDVVRESDAISAAPPILLADEVRAGRLGVVRYAAPWVRLNYGFIYLRDRMLSPAARAFMTEVRRIEAEVSRATEALGPELAVAVEADRPAPKPARRAPRVAVGL